MLNIHPLVYAFPDCSPDTSTNKEAHYWDWNFHRGEGWYEDLMRPDAGDKLSVDITPDYALLSSDMIADCKRINPAAKVIYILRDPMARALSALKVHLMWMGEERPKTPLQVDEVFTHLKQWSRLDPHTDYVRNHTRWAQHYDNIIVLNFDDLQNDPRTFAHRIFNYIGLDMSQIAGERRNHFDHRMNNPLWVAPDFEISDDVHDFLKGFFWKRRQNITDYFDISFREIEDGLLE